MNVMNRQDNLETRVEPTVNQDSDRPQGSLRRVDAARSLALLDEPKALTTRELEDAEIKRTGVWSLD